MKFDRYLTAAGVMGDIEEYEPRGPRGWKVDTLTSAVARSLAWSTSTVLTYDPNHTRAYDDGATLVPCL
jgi:hypothetical protein